MAGSIRSGRESSVLRSVIRELEKMKAAGCMVWWVKVAGGPRQRSGLPDLHITLDGRSIWIELKSPTGEATPLQLATLRKISEAGAIAGIVRSVEEFRELIQGDVTRGE